MSLSIIDPGVDLSRTIRETIESAIPGARAEVVPSSPGHFEIRVTAAAFAGKSLVQQQQMVYGAITPLMKGDNAPVHAIDRLQTKVS
jgi:stress-induced morphogen